MRLSMIVAPGYNSCERAHSELKDERSLYKVPVTKNAANSQTKQRDLFQAT